MKRLTAFLLAGVTVLSLTGCVPRYADTAAVERRNTRPTTVVTQQPTDVMTGENAESTPVPTEEPIIEKPENVVFAENNTARIQMPSDTLTVTFEGKDIKPCNDSVGTLQQAYGDLFTDNSHLNFSRWVLEYAIGENQELVIHGPGGIYKSDALPNANNIIPTFFQFGGLRNLQAEDGIQFMFLGITENATFDDVLKTMSQYGEPVSVSEQQEASTPNAQWPVGMGGPQFAGTVKDVGETPRTIVAEEANVFFASCYDAATKAAAYGLCIDMGSDAVLLTKRSTAPNEVEHVLNGAIEMFNALKEHGVHDVVIYTDARVAQYMSENASRLLNGRSEVCRRYIDMAWNTMTSVSVRFVTSPVKSEYAQLTASTVNCFIKPRV